MITFQIADFRKALERVKPAVASRGSLPILSTILLAPDETATIEVNPKTMGATLVCGSFRTVILGRSTEEFPTFPSVNGETEHLVLPGNTLAELVKQTVFCASSDDSRPVLTAVAVEVDKDLLTLSATDSYRLATRTVSLGADTGLGTRSWNPPARAFQTLVNILGGGETLTMHLLPSHLVSSNGDTTVTIRLLEGPYPNYRRVIEQHERVVHAVLPRAALYQATRLANLFAENRQIALIFSAPDEQEQAKLTVASTSTETGENQGTLSYLRYENQKGEEIGIGLNARYLQEALAAIPTENVVLETKGRHAPMILYPEGLPDYTQLIMPMNLRK